MKIGFHAPPPGALTGVADYAETLLKALSRSAPPDATIEFCAEKADVQAYHLGNNRLHADIYARAVRTPGIVVIHDAVMHHFMLGALPEAGYVDEFVYNYGEWSRHVAEDLWRDRGACAVDPRFFHYPMLRRAVENARAVIVHNPGAAAIARDHGARNISVIPHFFETQDVPDAFETGRFRQSIGVDPGVTLFGIFGYLRESKRVLPCMQAFRRLNTVRPSTALLIAGEVVSRDLERLLAHEPAHPAIHRVGHLSEQNFRIAAASVDCCLNLRYPAAGETSGIAIRLMGVGKPVIVTEGPENSDIPATGCLRVPPGADEVAALLDQMALVADFPVIARQIGEQAREHIRAHQSLENVALQYWQVIESVVNSSVALT